MDNFINKLIKKIFKLTPTYSQEGEDIILERLFNGKNKGFFIDVGAHHPKRFSNTYLLYLKGWHGINIEPMPGIKQRFDKLRPRDINLDIGISIKEGDLNYHIFNETALNTFSEKEANKKNGSNNGRYKLLHKKKIKTLPLKKILSTHLHQDQSIDFLTIDVEGLDLDVLKSNDWSLFRPKFVLVEDLNRDDLEKKEKGELWSFMNKNGYKLRLKTYNTLFFENAS